MEVQAAVAKVSKYASSDSGDTLEMIERPGGGLSFVLVDGQLSGKSAKAISNVVARKAVSLLADGVRDGAAARAASDYLYTYRSGKVLATLNILSLDLATRSLVITRNNPAPAIVLTPDSLQVIDGPSEPVGTRRGVRPTIHETRISPGLVALVFTDGLTNAGERSGRRLDLAGLLEQLRREGGPEPRAWADALLLRAVDLDDGRPADDISLVVAAIRGEAEDSIRRMTVSMPF
jgi:serine phosphatase RsbU (regulator of sigma subunit)